MPQHIENLGALERKVTLQFAKSDLLPQRQGKLKQLGKNLKIAGFRPGKVPAKMVEKQYGQQVDFELSFDHASNQFFEFAKSEKIQLVGQPRLEPKSELDAEQIEFDAYFEVFPEVLIGDISSAQVTQYHTELSDQEVDNTLELLRKQRVVYQARSSELPAQTDDQVTIDFVGTLDGVEFSGGKADDFKFVIGQGQMLPEFEAAAIALAVGQERIFPLTFPIDYHGKDVAGKTVEFKIVMKQVEYPELPEINDEFAASLGIAEGGVSQVRTEISKNLAREVARRTKGLLKKQAMDILSNACAFDLPAFLVSQEEERLIEMARQDLEQRGVPNAKDAPIPEGMFTPQAKERVKLGLILNSLVKEHGLKASPEQIQSEIEDQAASYDDPQEVTRWYYSDPARLSDIESIVMESNVVKYVMEKATVIDKNVTFAELSQLK
ncbi:MAG: trigger factor [Betaproteobacteria bacterium]|jgi:trigger factor|nr:trigger factor [Betaproteobacteria bacterium]